MVGTAGETAAAALADALYEKLCSDRPASFPLRRREEALLGSCEPFRFGENDALAGWRVGEGPLVFLTHGWGGCGAQMAKLALALAGQGFCAIFFDAGSHGASETMRMGFDRFMADAAALQSFMGTAPYAWVGHSAGALALMAARRTHRIAAQRYACIAPPFFPYVPIERMRAMGASEEVLEHVKPRFAHQFESDWAALEGGLAWTPEPGGALFLAYDGDDNVAHPEDGDAVRKAWPGATLMRTQGFGHNRILQSDEVVAALSRHLAQGRPT